MNFLFPWIHQQSFLCEFLVKLIDSTSILMRPLPSFTKMPIPSHRSKMRNMSWLIRNWFDKAKASLQFVVGLKLLQICRNLISASQSTFSNNTGMTRLQKSKNLPARSNCILSSCSILNGFAMTKLIPYLQHTCLCHAWDHLFKWGRAKNSFIIV